MSTHKQDKILRQDTDAKYLKLKAENHRLTISLEKALQQLHMNAYFSQKCRDEILNNDK